MVIKSNSCYMIMPLCASSSAVCHWRSSAGLLQLHESHGRHCPREILCFFFKYNRQCHKRWLTPPQSQKRSLGAHPNSPKDVSSAGRVCSDPSCNEHPCCDSSHFIAQVNTRVLLRVYYLNVVGSPWWSGDGSAGTSSQSPESTISTLIVLTCDEANYDRVIGKRL